MAKVFVSHVTAEKRLTEAFCASISALGHQPVLVEREASLGMPPNEKVAHYLGQCEAAVVLATRDPEGGEGTRPNIIEEVGRIQQRWRQPRPPWVLFVERGVGGLPSNVGTTWHDLDRECLAPALEMTERELRELLGPCRSPGPQPEAAPAAGSVPPRLAFRPMSDDWMNDPGRPRLPHRADGPGPSHPTLVWVLAGKYMMGSKPFEHATAPTPLREIQLARGFWMQECPVTNAQYAGFLNDLVRSGEGVAGLSVLASQDVDITKDEGGEYCVRGGREDYPVVGVDWHGARVYAERYWMRLPTEDEWEYAARGPQNRVYPWGNDWEPERCCCPSNPGPLWRPGPKGRYVDGQDPSATGWAAAYAQGPKATVQTIPVPPDARGRWHGGESWCGAVDMAGNVLEWCEDTWVDAEGRMQSGNRVVRGGNYANCDSDCKTFCRRHHPASTYARSSVGFRCVVDWAAVEALRAGE